MKYVATLESEGSLWDEVFELDEFDDMLAAYQAESIAELSDSVVFDVNRIEDESFLGLEGYK
tara:strand:- start:8344 stop:8529 length:186 start_codon:yes stop_codon:yes gene_type:complete